MLGKFKEYIEEEIIYLEELDKEEFTSKNDYYADKLNYYNRMLSEIEYFQSNYKGESYE